MIEKKYFDDYLDLLNKDLSKYKYIIFFWNSWSWKSSYISYLFKNNKSLSDNVIVIDEIFDFFDLLKIFIKLCTNKQLIIASHLNIIYYYIFRIFWKILFFKTDDNLKKIKNYLDYKKYNYSEKTLKQFINFFWATYTDLDLILEKYDWNNFDEAYNKFMKYNRVKFVWNKNNIKIYGKEK